MNACWGASSFCQTHTFVRPCRRNKNKLVAYLSGAVCRQPPSPPSSPQPPEPLGTPSSRFRYPAWASGGAVGTPRGARGLGPGAQVGGNIVAQACEVGTPVGRFLARCPVASASGLWTCLQDTCLYSPITCAPLASMLGCIAHVSCRLRPSGATASLRFQRLGAPTPTMARCQGQGPSWHALHRAQGHTIYQKWAQHFYIRVCPACSHASGIVYPGATSTSYQLRLNLFLVRCVYNVAVLSLAG